MIDWIGQVLIMPMEAVLHLPLQRAWGCLFLRTSAQLSRGLSRYGRVKACPVLLALGYYHVEMLWVYRKSVRMLQLSRPTFGSHYRE